MEGPQRSANKQALKVQPVSAINSFVLMAWVCLAIGIAGPAISLFGCAMLCHVLQ